MNQTLFSRWSVQVACVALLMWLADWLFYDQPVGWTAGLFALSLVVMVGCRNHAVAGSGWGRLALAVGVLLALTLMDEPAPLRLIAAGTALILLAVGARSKAALAAGDAPMQVLVFATTRWLQLLRDAALMRKWMRRRPTRWRTWLRATGLWLAAAAASGVFVLLFAWANPVIAEVFADLSLVLEYWLESFALSRPMLWLGVAMGAWALLRAKRRHRSGLPIASVVKAPGWWTSIDQVSRCLVMFNVVFLLQNAMDAIYLVGGATLPHGMTHAQYAHRGAYPLIAAALLAAAFVLNGFRPNGPAQRSALCRGLVYLWLGQTVALTLSSMWRLGIYVEAYSFTRLRFAAGAWMLLVAMGLVWIGWRIARQRSNDWLWRMNLVTLAAVITGCCLLNIDGMIAHYNVRHCREVTGEGAPLDVEYLVELGVEALPAIDAAMPKVAAEQADRLAEASRKLLEELEREQTGWRGWTWRRHRLTRELADRSNHIARADTR